MKSKKNVYIFLGPPGSGKGTQADMLGKELRLPVISIGELLRLEINKKTKLGGRVKNNLRKGILISDKLVYNILKKRLKKKDVNKGIIFDGFPRRKEQIEYIEKNFIFKKVDIMVFYINVSDKEAKARIGGRRVCDCGASYHLKYNPPKIKNTCDLCNEKIYARKDDKIKIISLRLNKFHSRIRPILEYFSSNAILCKINGEKDIMKVYKDVTNKIIV